VADLADLPGSELVSKGLVDLAEGRETAESLLVQVARERLGELGLEVTGPGGADAELRLYALLCRDGVADPYSAYNGLLRRLDKLLRALDHASP
jgi:hypothetical protein